MTREHDLVHRDLVSTDSSSTALDQYIEGWHPEPLEQAATPDADRAGRLGDLLPEWIAARSDDALPPMWHWPYFAHFAERTSLGPDGHPLDGHFLPPIPQRRRMFAGGRLSVSEPLRLGREVRSTSQLVGARVTSARSGPLLFVTVRSEFEQQGRTCAVEEQDIVYRSGEPTAAGGSSTLQPESDPLPHQVDLSFDPVLLFLFSCLTANAHRIHYDRTYAQDVEGHRDLVVHGPLLALLLAERLRASGPLNDAIELRYRFHRPVFVDEQPRLTWTDVDDSGEAKAAIIGPAGELRASLQLASAPPT